MEQVWFPEESIDGEETEEKAYYLSSVKQQRICKRVRMPLGVEASLELGCNFQRNAQQNKKGCAAQNLHCLKDILNYGKKRYERDLRV